MPFEEDLSEFLRDCSSLLLVGMGSRIRRDDAAGVRVVSRLRGKVPPSVGLLDCGTVPEDFTPVIKRSAPSHIIFFDAVDMGAGVAPGAHGFVDEGRLLTGSISTHKQSVKMVFRLIREGLPGVRIGLVGIQPKSLDFGTGLSRPVDRGVNALVGELARTVAGSCGGRPR
ncbi:MAG TPA: hydrogenase maturation protease [Candidatus Methanomethylicus sp.]|nr:hydrogenase maturation protease [Candidatus Methanomethylicus sp.]